MDIESMNGTEELLALTPENTDMEGKYLTFFVGEQIFSLPIACVIEIVQVQPINTMPELPYYVKGIINMRGKVIPVIDMNLRFGRSEREYTERTCIIIIEINGNQVGFIVDAVDEVLDITPENISPPPALAERGSTYIVGVGKLEGKIVLMLDSAILVGEQDLNMLGSM
ncbi:MAG: chemotaxis protein CheW [Oscillospiraceae bacterium]|jgi:purine-binding chemotaxis protein CheW|nr:chemotaxis protein CheW [Oscillospiraceae bacterium]